MEKLNIGERVRLKTNQVLVVNKPPGLPVQPDATGDTSLYELAKAYAKSELHLAHRLDRPTSGLVLFAKKKPGLADLQRQFAAGEVKKVYLAVVAKALPAESGELQHYLRRDGRRKKAYVVDAGSEGAKAATLAYKLVGRSERYYCYELIPRQGRFHQIRAQLAAAGSPIKGDVKYGARRANKDRSIGLHARSLTFVQPISHERVTVHAAPPDEALWRALVDFKPLTD